MPERNLTYRITARDDASAVTSKIAAAAKRDFGTVQDELDDTATAGKRMAQALERVADDLTSELDRTEQAAEELARALGPEFVARVGEGGVDKVVTDLRKAGLTFDDIEAEADELAAAIKRVEDVSERAAGGMRTGFDDVDVAARKTGETVDRTGSVFANFAGNAVQDIPGISGSFGALNVAAGQFAEYATEGGIALGGFVKALGPIAGVTAAIGLISSRFQKMNEAAELNREKVEQWVEAMRDGKTAIEAMTEEAQELGRVEVGLAHMSDDLTGSLDKMKLTLDDFTRLTQMSDEQLGRWVDSMIEAGRGTEENGLLTGDLAHVIAGVTQQRKNLTAADAEAAESLRVVGAATEDTTRATEGSTDAIEENRRALEEREEAIRSQTDAELSLREANLRTREAFQRLTDVTNDATATAEDREGAAYDVQRAIMAEGDAARAAAETTAAAQGLGTIAVQQGSQAQIAHLTNVANTLSPFSPLRAWLNGYIGELRSVPTQVRTDITVSGNAAGPRFGARAEGGPVKRGEAYVVGEKRPELFVPDQDGVIVPEVPPTSSPTAFGGAAGGSLNLVVSFDTSGLPPLERALLPALAKAIRVSYGGDVNRALGRG